MVITNYLKIVFLFQATAGVTPQQHLRRTSSSTSTAITSNNKSSSKTRDQKQQERKLWTHVVSYTDPKTIFTKDEMFAVATDESYGFFFDVPVSDWDRMKSIMKHRREHNHPRGDWRAESLNNPNYYHENWNPDFSCKHEKRIGKMGDGGKWVCDPHRIAAISSVRKTADGRDSPCLVYSVGSSGKHDFEHGIMDAIGEDVCEIHTFEVRSFEEMRIQDTTDEEIRKTKKINFHYNWGLQSSNDPPQEGFLTLEQTIQELGHVGRVIDIFKIDCEGCEWTTYLDWLNAPATLQQILVEVHKEHENRNDFFQAIQDAGYVTFHKEPNALGKGRCLEYAFLKLKPDDYDDNSKSVSSSSDGRSDIHIAGKESFGFFYDVSAADWQTAKDIMFERRQYNHRFDQDSKVVKGVPARRFYNDNWEPDFSCQFEMRLGNIGSGGKWVCDPHRMAVLNNIRKTPDGRPDRCLVYSIGNTNRFDFEKDLNDAVGGGTCEIHKFIEEPILSDEWRDMGNIQIHDKWGFIGSDKEPREGYHTIQDTIRTLGHEGRTIDILKVDCNGCEWSTYEDWFDAPAQILQILPKLHGNPKQSKLFMPAMQDAGYVTFHKEFDYESKGAAFEYSFLKLDIA